MTQYYIKIQLKLCRWREHQPHVSHCFKGWSFKNEWDTSLVLYKSCTQVRDESMHRNTVSCWACWPEFDPWDLHSEGKALTPRKFLWSAHMCPGACTGTYTGTCTCTCTHKHTLIAECSNRFPKIRIWGLGEKVVPWWKHLLGKRGDQSSHPQNSSSMISALRRWTGHSC